MQTIFCFKNPLLHICKFVVAYLLHYDLINISKGSKYRSFTPSGCKDLGITNFELLAKNQFFFEISEFCLCKSSLHTCYIMAGPIIKTFKDIYRQVFNWKYSRTKNISLFKFFFNSSFINRIPLVVLNNQ